MTWNAPRLWFPLKGKLPVGRFFWGSFQVSLPAYRTLQVSLVRSGKARFVTFWVWTMWVVDTIGLVTFLGHPLRK